MGFPRGRPCNNKGHGILGSILGSRETIYDLRFRDLGCSYLGIWVVGGTLGVRGV